MDSDLNYQQFSSTPPMVIFFGLLFGALLFYFLLLWKPISSTKKNKPKNHAPEAAGSWPLIGHLHLLGGKNQLPHIILGAMADKYGPAFTIRIGSRPALIVSSWEVAKEIFTTKDKVWASRPRQVATKHLGYDSAMFGFSPYGHYWRELRKIVNRELLSNSRLELLKHVWDSEINTSIKQLFDLWANENNIGGGGGGGGGGGLVMVEMKRWFADLTLNMSLRMVAGKRYYFGNDQIIDEARRCQNGLRNMFTLVGLFVPSDALPFLGWLDLGGHEKEMKKVARELDVLMEGWLEEHKRKRLSSAGTNYEADGDQSKNKGAGEQDFMEVMLSILGDVELSEFDPDTINKATCLMLILGGSDTTMVSLVWAFALLVNHPDVLKKVQDELDIHVGRERQVDELDIKNLTYLQAVIKETMRLYPAGPLGGPRESTEDCTVAGYHIPAETRLIVNTWKIQRDPRVWSDPLEFQPERFLTKHADIDLRGQNFELIPFGLGRRICPGVSFALQVVPLTLARLIHGFEFKTPTDAPTDMTESAGLTNIKATPLDVLVTPRLPSKLYNVC